MASNVKNDIAFYFSTLVAMGSMLILSSCLPDPLEIDGIPKIRPEIVVSSQIISDESLVVLLTKSFGALDASDDSDPEQVLRQIAVTDAVVILNSHERRDTLFSLGNGFYGGVFIPFEAGAEYTLNVESASLGNVTATTRVKPRISFEELEAELYFDGYDDTLAQISYTINDPAEKNWYMLNVLNANLEDLQENLLNPRDFTRLFDDTEFNGERYWEVFRVFPQEFKAGDTIAVYLSNISKEYSDFMNLRLDNRFSFVEYLSEPLNYPTNVVGGRGFFNLYLPDIRVIILEE